MVFTSSSPTLMRAADCEVRAWFSKHLPQQENESKGFGTALHSALERWHKEGVSPPQPTLRAALIKAAAHLQTGGTAEGWIRIHIDTELRINGKYDHMGVLGDTVIITDYKTTATTPRVGKREQLLADPQVMSYAVYALRHAPEVQHVRVRWLYFKTKLQVTPDGYDRVVVSVVLKEETFTRAEIDARTPALFDRARRSLRIVNTTTPHALARNTACCYDYGECEYKRYCDRKEQMATPAEMMKLLESMKSPAPAPAPAPAPQVLPQPTPSLLGGNLPTLPSPAMPDLSVATYAARIEASPHYTKPAEPQLYTGAQIAQAVAAHQTRKQEIKGSDGEVSIAVRPSAVSDADLGAAVRVIATFVRSLF